MIKSLKNKQGGFTLIELMVVIVIIGILVAIALPNFIGAQDRAKLSSVKANMHTVQTMLETYAVDWGGTYPGDYATLNQEATDRSYNKDYKNPFNPSSAAYADYTDGTGNVAGAVEYDFVNSTTYYVYGNDKAGDSITDKGQPFTLTNS